nr:hypothetical protein CFP56_25118 [Quercus suber]
MENQPEMVQANMETNEGVISNFNANDLPVTKEVAINVTLSPDDCIDSNSPMVVKVSMDTSNKGEAKTKETKLTLDSITPENLFDIQIKEIDADLAQYDEGPIIKANSGKWSRLLRAQISPPSQQGGKEDNGLGKRAMDDNRILLELPNKRRQVSVGKFRPRLIE